MYENVTLVGYLRRRREHHIQDTIDCSFPGMSSASEMKIQKMFNKCVVAFLVCSVPDEDTFPQIGVCIGFQILM